MLRFPGFIDICTDIPAGRWNAVSRSAVRSGYTSLIAAPLETEVYSERNDVILSMAEPEAGALCDYARMALITPENIRTIDEWASEVPAAMADFSVISAAGSFAQMNLLSRLFNRWPAEKPICVRGNEDQIGSAVFMGQVHGRKVHICSVTTRGEIELVDEAKRAGIPVTCSIHPLSLLLSAETQKSSGLLQNMGTEEDRQALWKHFSEIDCFTSTGYGKPGEGPERSLEIMLPLLLSMVRSRMLTAEDILRRCCVNPARIFGISPDPATVVETEDFPESDNRTDRFIRSVKLHGAPVYSADAPIPERAAQSSRIRGFSV